MKIIVDAMGGDNAPQAPVMGAIQANKEYGVGTTPAGSSRMPFSSRTFRMSSPRPTRVMPTPYSLFAWMAPMTGA